MYASVPRENYARPDVDAPLSNVWKWQILLQKSKVAAPRIFRENKKRKMIADSYTLNRVAEIAGEFDARGHVPPHLYTEDAPTARRIFDHLCKTTFATWGNSGIEPDKGTGNQLSRNG